MDKITSVTTVEGFEMYVDPADGLISGAIIPTRNWEPHVTAVFKREINSRSGVVVVDVGANMGWFALTAAAQPQCAKAIALEPNHGNLQLLYRSILANQFDKVTVYPYAAGDKPALLRLTSSSGPTGTGYVSSAGEDRNESITFVQSVRLDDLLKDEPRIDIVKMDIDGHEPTVLKGMQQLLARHQPVIFTEFFPMGIRQLAGMEPEDYLKMLTELGYQFAVIQGNGTEFACDGAPEVMGCWKRHGEALGVGDTVHVDLIARPVGKKGRKMPAMASSPSPPGHLISCMCTQAQLESPVFQEWIRRVGRRQGHLHRKAWEFCFVSQALDERDMLQPGRRGLGFAVGREPLSALFAQLGCEIMATDLPEGEAAKGGWVETGQHAASLEALNATGLCPEEQFHQRVSFREVDMRHLPEDLGSYDFLWSSCSLEHLGTLELGEQFIYDSLRYLKPGGVAVHTTEFNVSSNMDTITEGPAVLYRRCDMERIGDQLRSLGHKIEMTFAEGDLPADKFVDKPPYKQETHLKLEYGGHVVTSFGLIIQKNMKKQSNVWKSLGARISQLLRFSRNLI